jgi:hypothetical protein
MTAKAESPCLQAVQPKTDRSLDVDIDAGSKSGQSGELGDLIDTAIGLRNRYDIGTGAHKTHQTEASIGADQIGQPHHAEYPFALQRHRRLPARPPGRAGGAGLIRVRMTRPSG